MSSFYLGLLTISLLTTVCRAASTDTIVVPVEQKVVEIHMSLNKSITAEESKRRRKMEILPYLGHGTCSGSFINGNGDILTARHCVAGFDEFEVMTFDRRLYTGTVIATSTAHDLALIHIDRRNTPYFELASEVRRGDTVFVLGSPLAITDTMSTGIIARLDGDVTLIDCSALPGNSGGPAFNKEQKMVGVVTAGFIVMFGVTHLNVMQSIDAVYFFLTEVLRGR